MNSFHARLVCFDSAPASEPTPDTTLKFTQDDLNKFLAEDRRKHQGQIRTIQQTLEETLTSKNLTAQEREQLANRVSELESQGRTKEQQAAHEKKQLEAQAAKEKADLTKERDQWQGRYHDLKVDHELKEAANGNDAFSASQIVSLLKPLTKLVPTQGADGKFDGGHRVVTVLKEKDETGKEVPIEHTPESAVRRMKELPAQFGNLFKSGVVSGIGSGSGAGVAQNGKLDVRKLTPQQYQEIRAKNPELLGLRRDRKRSV